MDKTFNELFDDFFKNNKPSKKSISKKPKKELPQNDDIKDEVQKIIDMVTNLGGFIQSADGVDEEQIDSTMGKPDKIEFYNEGNMFFEKRTWYMEHGELVKIIVTDEPTLNNQPKTKTLQEELDDALAEEKYEKAAEIRDRMTKTHKKLDKPVKVSVKKVKSKK